MFGVAPFFWLPFMNSIGRRPALLISVLGTTAANIGSIFCKTFGQQLATCCVAAFFAAPPTALGSTVVAELYFQHQRGAKTGLWKAFWNIGAPGGPFLMGFVAERAGIKWVFGVFALANFALFIAYFIFAPETLYSRQYDNDNLASSRQVTGWRQQMRFKPVHHGAWSFRNMVRPFKILTKVRIMLPVCAYVLIFAYTAVAVIITVPQVTGEKFHLRPEGIGLQFIAFIVGFGLGELLSGPGSDLWMKHCISRRKGVKVIEDRLWLAYIGIEFSVVGLVVWGVTTQQATSGHWVVWPNIGMALDAFGCQILTTVLITYAIDVDPTSAGDTGLILNLLRQEYGFVCRSSDEL
jgi:MFS family permease